MGMDFSLLSILLNELLNFISLIFHIWIDLIMKGLRYIHTLEFANQMNVSSFLLVEIMMFPKDFLCLLYNYLEIAL